MSAYEHEKICQDLEREVLGLKTTWGSWRFDVSRGLLIHSGTDYEVPLPELCSAGDVARWLFHMRAETWLADADFRAFAEALEAFTCLHTFQ